MLDALTQRLSNVVKTLRGHSRLTEDNVQEMLREVRLVLLDAVTTLDSFMVDGVPDEDRFKRSVGDIVGSLSRAAAGRSVRGGGRGA